MDIAVIVAVVVVVVAIEPYSSVYGHGNWLRSSCGHQLSVLQLSHEPAYFMKPTQLLHQPGLFESWQVCMLCHST